MDKYTKAFDKDLSDKYDDPARVIMMNWLSTWCSNVRENDPEDWKHPDLECDDYYHELQVIKSWTEWNKPPYNIRIWGRKIKYVTTHLINVITNGRPVLFWGLSNDGKAAASLNAEALVKRPQTCVKSDKTESGNEFVWDVPTKEWTIHKLEVK